AGFDKLRASGVFNTLPLTTSYLLFIFWIPAFAGMTMLTIAQDLAKLSSFSLYPPTLRSSSYQLQPNLWISKSARIKAPPRGVGRY
ncbi:MAG TPA: hypothetical protein PLC37_11945, partial [Smithellaceae bacterium]|nr:hypothetical protein [Smithellaceae bacterium]